MNYKSPRQMEDDRRLAERAAEWITVLPEATSEERAEFVNWIKKSPQHLQEFLLASHVVHGLGEIDLQNLGELRAQVGAEESNIVHLSRTLPIIEEPRKPHGERRTRWRWAAGIAAVAATLAVIGFQWISEQRTYATDVGEQRTVHLEDGSVMQLNARSQAQVLFSDRERGVRLLEGEAMFKVEHDRTRAFRVYTSTNVIQALGTEFNVLRRPSGTTVSVIEGKVRISTDGALTGPHLLPVRPMPHQDVGAPSSSDAKLEAGEEARIGLDGRIEQRTAIDVMTVAAWRHNRLDFRAEKLIDIAAQFNRYNDAPQVIIQDDIAAARRYSGVFDANDPRSLAEFLREDAGLAIEKHGSAIVVRARETGAVRQ